MKESSGGLKRNKSAESISSLSMSVADISGVGPKYAESLEKIKINTVKDLLLAFPYRYEVLSYNVHDEKGILSGTFENAGIINTYRGKRLYKAVFKNNNGYFACLWVNFNVNYPSGLLTHGNYYYFYGTISSNDGMPAIFHPEFINKNDTGSIRSVYTVPAGMNLSTYRKILKTSLEKYLKNLKETLPVYILDKYKYPNIVDAVNTIHNPQTELNVESILKRKHPAYARFIYEELFYMQINMLLKQKSYRDIKGISFKVDNEYLLKVSNIMPFKLTGGQKRVLVEIFNNMVSEKQMNRLIQGDVGSGKTIIAFISASVAVNNGYQAVILAPTEVLAEQHYNNALKFFEKLDISTALLTGSTNKKNKDDIKKRLSAGEIDIIVGTHALLEDDVEFHKLGFVIADEQHRFGVHQRKILIEKGWNPDILLMTATPIPRSLAMTIYGDLDVSIIDEMPPGRIPCITKKYTASNIMSAFKFVEERLNENKKAYFVYPLIDESDKLELKAATQSFEEVQKYFTNKKAGLLHGKMKADEKRQLIHDFKYGELDILVSTTVIEVGVDVPEATVILIENAERFGLSQLHQLRGRVGRNDEQSYCLLVTSDNISENSQKRIDAMLKYTDGFKLAEVDLDIRGQGDFFGTRQSGMPDLKYADIIKDIFIIKNARNDASLILDEDPELKLEKNKIIIKYLQEMYEDTYSYFGVG